MFFNFILQNELSSKITIRENKFKNPTPNNFFALSLQSSLLLLLLELLIEH
jgi:hypothetical protein